MIEQETESENGRPVGLAKEMIILLGMVFWPIVVISPVLIWVGVAPHSALTAGMVATLGNLIWGAAAGPWQIRPF